MERQVTAAYLMLATVLLIFCYGVLTMPAIQLAGIFLDDGFYYLTIARNAAAGKGFTFDGINATNGFQPLWLYVLIPLFKAGRAMGEVGLARAAMLLQAVFLFAGGHFLIRFTLAYRREILLPVVVYFLYFVFHHLLNGMESALLFVLSMATLRFAAEKERISAYGPSVLHGALLGALFLTRVDAVFFPVALYAIEMYSLARRTPVHFAAWKYCLVSAAIFVSVAAAYCIFNFYSFGLLFPISGMLKTSGALFSGAAFSHLPPLILFLVIVTACAAFVLLFFARRKNTWPLRHLPPVASFLHFVLPAGLLCQFLFLAAFGNWAIYQSHFLPFFFFMPFLISALLPESFYSAVRKYGGPVAALSIAVFLKAAHNFTPLLNNANDREYSFRHASYRAAEWANNNLPAGTVIAMKDCGTFGYFFRGNTINLDGLVNSAEYQRALRSGELQQFLRSRRTGYFAHHSQRERKNGDEPGTYIFYFPARLYPGYGDSLLVRAADELYSSPEYSDNGFRTQFKIWKMR